MSTAPAAPATSAVRTANTYRVIDAIQRLAPLSRAELTAATGLSNSTVADVVVALQARGLIEATRQTGAGRGRPTAAIRLTPGALRLAGLHLDPGGLRLIVTDASGAALHADVAPFVFAVGPRVGDEVLATLGVLMARLPLSLGRINALGFAFPGLVDTELGLVKWAGVPIDPPLPLAAMLSARLGFPVFIENLVNTRARAERLYGDGRDVDDFAVVSPTLGLGQYIGGQLWRGPRGVNPEFRHFKVGIEGAHPCDCGAQGCLGPAAGTMSILAAGAALLGRAPPAFPGPVEPLLGELIAGARAGDVRLSALFERAARALGAALANVINLHDPARIIIAAASADLAQILRAPLEAAIRDNAFPRGAAPALVFKTDADLDCAMGAAALGLERLFAAPSIPLSRNR